MLFGSGCAPEQPTQLDHAKTAVAFERLEPIIDRPIALHIDSADSAAAYSWPDGTILVTTGLIETLTSEELTAALAHELGHLCLCHQQNSELVVFALHGLAPGDVEERADAVAAELLHRSGIAPSVLASALTKVRDAPGTSQEAKAGLSRRIAVLQKRNRIPSAFPMQRDGTCSTPG